MKVSQDTHTIQQKASADSFKPEHAGFGVAVPGVLQRMENRTGLPDTLKSGIENLSGYSMDDVKVHYNSAQPAQLQAHAYAQGTNIHVAPGQERHLPHEAWHVVQQKQGRVKPTLQMKGTVPVNDDAGLEHEADVMGAKARSASLVPYTETLRKENTVSGSAPRQAVAQRRHVGMMGLEAEVIGERLKFMAFTSTEEGEADDSLSILNDTLVSLEEYALGTLSGIVKVTLDNEMKVPESGGMMERNYTVEFVQNAVDVLGEKKPLDDVIAAWDQAAALWKALYEASADVDAPELKDTMEGHEGMTLDTKWGGGQFDAHAANPLITTEGEGGAAKRTLDWTKMGPFLDVQSEDPKVSPQLTAGASLVALDRAFLATLKPLKDHETFEEDQVPKRKQPSKASAAETQKDIALEEVAALKNLINRYLAATRPPAGGTKRYMKEYIPLMVRNSLDAVYNGMSERGKTLFKALCAKHITGGGGTTFKEPADAPIFNRTASKEAGATTITVEQLLLSIIKMKRNDLNTALEADAEADEGDAFSQASLAGLSEINGNAELLDKYHINSAQEMMAGVKGVIFENRLAQTIELSGMSTLFGTAVDALQKVEAIMNKEEE